MLRSPPPNLAFKKKKKKMKYSLTKLLVNLKIIYNNGSLQDVQHVTWKEFNESNDLLCQPKPSQNSETKLNIQTEEI